ncbi:MAG: hypothetical protein PVI11_01840 [Candidatus Aminicenantes bacterium]|jgi:hypothetical protein
MDKKSILCKFVLFDRTSSCQQEILPDLVVEDISCMGGNLYITVKNQGEGSLPEDWISLASLYMDGVVQEDILLNEPSSTTKGGISEPEGISNYLLLYDVPASMRIDLYHRHSHHRLFGYDKGAERGEQRQNSHLEIKRNFINRTRIYPISSDKQDKNKWSAR